MRNWELIIEMNLLEIKNTNKKFGDIDAARHISFGCKKGSILCLLGPSGCGKTTLLRIIAGLEKEDSGDVFLEGNRINHIPSYQRNFGFMFQDVALFPHKNVLENIVFGLLIQKMPRSESKKKALEFLKIVGLPGFENKRVDTLSGGEKQRVALARSLAPSPVLLMLDEPLGSLDRGLRERLLADLKTILKTTGTTSIFVTHDQVEAFAIADRIAVMREGKIEQIDTPENLFARPDGKFVAEFLGFKNIVQGRGIEKNLIETEIGRFRIKNNGFEAVSLLIRPEGIQIFDGTRQISQDTHVLLKGKVKTSLFQGSHFLMTVLVNNHFLLSLNIPAQGFKPGDGDSITVAVDLDSVQIMQAPMP